MNVKSIAMATALPLGGAAFGGLVGLSDGLTKREENTPMRFTQNELGQTIQAALGGAAAGGIIGIMSDVFTGGRVGTMAMSLGLGAATGAAALTAGVAAGSWSN